MSDSATPWTVALQGSLSSSISWSLLRFISCRQVKNMPAMQETEETWIWSLGREDPLEKEMATTPVFFPRKSHGKRSLVGYRPWGRRVGHDWATNVSIVSVILSNHLILCCPPSPPALNLSQHQGLFQWVSFPSGGQSIGASASALSVNIQGWFPLGLTDVIFLQSKGLLILFQYHSSKASILLCSAFFMVQLSHLYMTTGETMALIRQTFVGKVMSLLFNMLSRLLMAFLPRSKPLLISWLESPSAVILEPRKIKSVTISTLSPSICHEVMRLDDVILCSFECWVLSQFFSFSSFTLIEAL